MFSIEKVVREKDGQKKEVLMLFGTGRLTNDPPAVKEVAGGYKVMQGSKDHNFSIAFNYRDKEGEKAKFYNLVLWGKTAENMAKCGYKGREVEVAGRIETQSYTNQKGEEVKFDVLVVERFDAKGKAKQQNGNADNANNEQEFSQADGEPLELTEDDIPF